MNAVPASLFVPRPLLSGAAPPARPAPARRGAGADLRREPETLHPSLWLADQLGRTGSDAVATGFVALDAELPGGGWPRRALSELLLPHAGVGEIRLLAPALLAAQRAGRLVMIFDPPAALSAAALAGLGFDVEALLVVQTLARDSAGSTPGAGRTAASGPGAMAPLRSGSDSLWALEQALKSGHVGAVVAWLPPRLRSERLRRLQLAAHQHDGPAFVMREAAVADRPTAAPLRLALQAGGADRLQVHVRKRRGPPLETPLRIELPSVLSAAARRRSGSQSEGAAALPAATFVNFA